MTPPRIWWVHELCDGGPTAGIADRHPDSCAGCGRTDGEWRPGAATVEAAVTSAVANAALEGHVLPAEWRERLGGVASGAVSGDRVVAEEIARADTTGYTPDPAPDRHPAYNAVYDVIRRYPTSGLVAKENARVWRAVEAALDAIEPVWLAAGRTAAAADPDLVRAILTGTGLADYVRIQHHTLGLHDHMGENLSCRGCALLARIAEGKTDD